MKNQIINMGEYNIESVNSVVKLFANRSSTTQAILTHDGTSDTETIINFGTNSNREINLTPSGLEILKTLQSMFLIVELHLNLAAAAIVEFNIWADVSVDGGITWVPYANSLKITNINSKDEGVLLFDFSLETEIQKGAIFRAVCTKIGSTDLNIQAPANLTVSTGTASGYATKLNMYYNVK